jgi:hypothetical protein
MSVQRGTGTASVVVAVTTALLAAHVGLAPAASAAPRTSAVQILNSLPVSPEQTVGYARELFRLWIDTDSDGCDTRAEVLMSEAVSGRIVGCAVVGGRWVSEYDGVVTDTARSFDIDHMVPLKEAWDSGAWRWTAGTRQSFANDLGYRHSLIAVSASSNRSKSDRDPAEWLPALARCAYAKQWIGVKYRWRLAVDANEKSSLLRVLRSCPRSMVLPSLANRRTDPNAVPSPPVEQQPGSEGSALDPRFDTCGAANAAGFGPYQRGVDPEYEWYIDRDRDGVACES